MRLTCPNCSARYEVADSMIPPEGRDVQCSNCSTTWFQPGRRTDQAPQARVERPVREAEPATTGTKETPAPESAGSEAATSADQIDTPVEEPTAAPQAALRRREIDPEVRDILREEAERETRLRQAEAAPVETQGEMPLSEEPGDDQRARRRAELDAAEDAFNAGALGPAARDLFPDIDEINSTLRDTRDRSHAEVDATDIDTLDSAPRRRRGTRIGFLLAIALAAAAAGIYGNTDRIAEYVPTAAPYLERYEEAVNMARFWLDDIAHGLGEATDGG
ncbi:thioredoxin [Rhodobacterales bacterium HKCCSP123]|nr:thioredoxin [Rhodobacterales bacterium HKCCSP123]